MACFNSFNTKGEYMKKLYVGNLSYSVTKEDLKEMFSEYKSITETFLIEDRATGRSKGFGFVEIEDSSEADKAIKEMDGKSIQGRNIRVNEAQPRTDKGGGGGGRGDNRRPRRN